MGEVGGNILALEGSSRRAAIVRSRTRDLENVTVLAEKFDRFECVHKFDLITLIGVLEYANLFTPGETPALTMLQRVRSLLKPEGKLIIAIENQLGLKYFAGAPEDHLGQPMYGVEGRYRADQPQTFRPSSSFWLTERSRFLYGRIPGSISRLQASRFDFDYEQGLSSTTFDGAALAWQSVTRDPQVPAIANFSLELAWPEVFKNRLVLDMTNSFLIAASPNAQQLTETNVLAYHFNAERKASYCKQTKFIQRKGEIKVEYSLLLGEGHYPADPAGPVTFVPIESSCYVAGTLLFYDFVRVIKTRGWSIEQVVQLMRRYCSVLQELLRKLDFTLDTAIPYAVLPGEFFDAVSSKHRYSQ